MAKPHGNSRLAKIGRPVLRRKRKAGAPKGNRNALKHGVYGAEFQALKQEVSAFRRRVRATIAQAEGLHRARFASSLPPVAQK
jgi:hypothetical protein